MSKEKRNLKKTDGSFKDSANNVKIEKKSSKKAPTTIPVNALRYVVVILLALSVATVGYYVSTNRNAVDEPVTLDTIYADTDLTYKEKSQVIAYEEGYDAGKNFLVESAKAAEGDPEAQAEFYSQASELAFNNEKYDEALDFAIKTDEIIPTVANASFAALSAEMLGDNEAALKYYKLAAERSPEEDKLNPDTTNYGHYLIKIEQFGGSLDEK